MRKLSIDRFEGNFAICEELADQDAGVKKTRAKNKEVRLFGIETKELPGDAAEGTILLIDDEGRISVELDETKQRRAALKKKQDALWE